MSFVSLSLSLCLSLSPSLLPSLLAIVSHTLINLYHFAAAFLVSLRLHCPTIAEAYTEACPHYGQICSIRTGQWAHIPWGVITTGSRDVLNLRDWVRARDGAGGRCGRGTLRPRWRRWRRCGTRGTRCTGWRPRPAAGWASPGRAEMGGQCGDGRAVPCDVCRIPHSEDVTCAPAARHVRACSAYCSVHRIAAVRGGGCVLQRAAHPVRRGIMETLSRSPAGLTP